MRVASTWFGAIPSTGVDPERPAQVPEGETLPPLDGRAEPAERAPKDRKAPVGSSKASTRTARGASPHPLFVMRHIMMLHDFERNYRV